METEKERRARLENDAATKRLRLAMEMDEERKARLEKMVQATTQLGWPWRQRKKEEQKQEWIRFRFDSVLFGLRLELKKKFQRISSLAL